MRQGFFGRIILKGGLVHKQIFNAEKVTLASFFLRDCTLGLNSAFKTELPVKLRQNLKLLVKNSQVKK